MLLICMLVCLSPNLWAAGVPERIVSLSPAITSELYDLNQAGKLVGVTRYCPNPGAKVAVVGSLTAINIERVMLLKPDLVLAGKDCNRKRDIDKLKSLGLRVEVFEGCEDFVCMGREFIRLGALVGSGNAARAIVSRTGAELEAAQRALPKQSLKVFWQVGINPLVAAGDKTFAGELIRRAGGANSFGDLAPKYPRVNREEVLVRDPDAIIIAAGMDSGDDPWRAMPQLKAVRTGRVYRIPAESICQPTPIKFLSAFKTVTRLLYPGIKP